MTSLIWAGHRCTVVDPVAAVRFPLYDDGALALGYAEATSVEVPAALLALLPVGPTLDPAAVIQPAISPDP